VNFRVHALTTSVSKPNLRRTTVVEDARRRIHSPGQAIANLLCECDPEDQSSRAHIAGAAWQAGRPARAIADVVQSQVGLLFLSTIHIQIHTHLKWEGYG
jgi:hypothetical protein